MLCQFQVYSKMTELYKYPLFFRFFSHISHYRVLSRVPCALWQTLLICFIYSSGYMSAPISQFIFSHSLLFKNFDWNIVDLQCCVSFRCTAKLISYTHTYIHFFFRFFAHIGYYKVLSRVFCAMWQVLITYLFYIQRCVYVNSNFSIYPSTSPTLIQNWTKEG